MYEVRDPIHQTIVFTDAEKRVIDHPFVQRLRYIRQLGLKSTVYPTAVHDRFAHALGAMHLAGRVFDALNAESRVFHALRSGTRTYLRRSLRFAALLHDVGHGPFSHASEALMPRLSGLGIPRGWYTHYNAKRQATHEDYSVLLIKTLGSPRENIFSPAEAQDIASLVHKHIHPSAQWVKRFRTPKEAAAYHIFFARLISGEIDVDRLDYLLRDAYFTGVPYGVYDLEWLLHTIGTRMTSRGPVLVIKEGGLRAFEDFLLARYHMFLQVYFHRTTSAFEHYVERAISEHEIPLKIPTDPHAYAELRDGSVIEALYAAAKEKGHPWSRLLVNRVPAKLVYRFDRGNIEDERRYRTVLHTLRRAKIRYFERTARRTLTEHPVLVPGASRIFVEEKFLDRVRYTPIERASPLLQKYNEQIDRVYVYVFREDYPRALEVLHKVYKMR
ncbi:HD domain-containing protein [Candidatus Uhrbacteria bacterium]|nr:HD domain-containing protein [Candidatus Uhrbacteria bacterium]